MTKTSSSQITSSHALDANDAERNLCGRLHARRSLLAGLTALALSAGCADTQGATQGDEASSDGEELAPPPLVSGLRNRQAIVAEVKLPGRTVQFIEPEPGVLIEIETGNVAEVRASAQASDDAHLSSVERYERLTRRAAPEQLVRAQELVDEVGLREDAEGGLASSAEQVQSPALRAGNKSKVGPQYADRDWFLDSYCQPTDRHVFWIEQQDEYSSIVRDNANFLRSGAYSISGSIRYYVTYYTRFKSETLSVWLGSGQYGALRMTSTAQATFGSTVDYTEGDTYDHCVNYHF
jgi:hypothetical protein